jgi:hypothetical protein
MAFFRRKKAEPAVDPFEALLGTLPAVLRPIMVLAHQYGGDACSTTAARSDCLTQLLRLMCADDAL